MIPRRLPAVVAGLLALLTTQLGAVTPSASASPPTNRTYQAAGTPVKGTDDPGTAPALAPGVYTEQMGNNDTKYYAVDVPAGHTAYVSVTMISDHRPLETIKITSLRATGEDCATQSTLMDGTLKVAVAHIRWTADNTRACGQPGRTALRVTRPGAGPPADIELLVFLEAPVSDEGPFQGRIASYVDTPGPANPVTGGGSFATAATLSGSGHFGDVLSGREWAFYRVRLEWGQSLAFRIRVGQGSSLFEADVYLYSPTRETVATASGFTLTDEVIVGDGSPTKLATRPVRYQNRTGSGAGRDNLPGWYYIAVRGDGRDAARALDIGVSVGGTQEPGPVYRQTPRPGDAETAPDNAPLPPAAADPGGPDGSPPPDTSPAAPGGPPRNEGDAQGDEESSAFGGPLVWIGLPAALLLGAGTTALLLRRRPKDSPYGPSAE